MEKYLVKCDDDVDLIVSHQVDNSVHNLEYPEEYPCLMVLKGIYGFDGTNVMFYTIWDYIYKNDFKYDKIRDDRFKNQ